MKWLERYSFGSDSVKTIRMQDYPRLLSLAGPFSWLRNKLAVL